VDRTGRITREIHAYFAKAGFSSEDYSIRTSRYPRSAFGIINQFMDKVPGDVIVRIYAVGGDGILFDCLNGIVGLPNVELASLPYGTTNDFIRAFGEGKTKLFKSLEKQVSSPALKTDIIYCGSNYALNSCCIGVESESLLQTLRLNKTFEKPISWFHGLGSLMYVAGGVLGIRNEKVRRQEYTINMDGEEIRGKFAIINIANGSCYGGNKIPSPAALPDDGLLEVIYMESKDFLHTAQYFIPYLSGKYYKYPNTFIHKQARKITITSPIPLLVNLDGEVFFDTNLTAEIVPGAVNFVAPGGLRYKRRFSPNG
jgi:YegS/Rv2252/BmrU family lipid kinase